MKVVGIFGSPRQGGNTDLLLGQMLQGAEEEGAGVERIVVSNLQISPCQECNGCHHTGECMLQDDMQGVYHKLSQADWVILASPIFFYGVTAQLKALIDRGQALWVRKYLLKLPPPRQRRRGIFISVGGTKGERLFEGAEWTVRYFLDAMGVEYVGGLFFRGIDASGDILQHPEALAEAHEIGRRLARGGNPFAKPGQKVVNEGDESQRPPLNLV